MRILFSTNGMSNSLKFGIKRKLIGLEIIKTILICLRLKSKAKNKNEFCLTTIIVIMMFLLHIFGTGSNIDIT